MAKSKYDKTTFPILAEGWAREGLTEKQIAKNLGVSKSTFESYKIKHPDFLDSIKRGKEPVDFEVENALLKKALGGVYQDSSTEDRIVNGKKTTLKKVIIKQIPPDVVACIYWLKNRKPAQWRDKIDEGGSSGDNLTETLKDFSAAIREGDTNG